MSSAMTVIWIILVFAGVVDPVELHRVCVKDGGKQLITYHQTYEIDGRTSKVFKTYSCIK